MLKRWAVGTVLVMALSSPSWGQEAAPEEQGDERPATPTHSIRVLQHPYDIASFYRSSQGGPYVLGAMGAVDPRYAIAGYYRSSQGGYAGYAPWGSPFWCGGYTTPRATPFIGYHQSIGENGDLFLVVPFLAPVGPLSGAFFGF